MIKVGDFIVLKKGISKSTLSTSDKYGRIEFPLEVKLVTPCNHGYKYDECKGCPGQINKERLCFGRDTIGLVVEPVKEWDD